jgi:hypothetical protein
MQTEIGLLDQDKTKCLYLEPFAQPYRDFENKIKPTKEQKKIARWVNHTAVFNSVDFKDFKQHERW